MMPIHWGLFNLALHAWKQPIEQILQLAGEKGIPLWSPEPGVPTEVVVGGGVAVGLVASGEVKRRWGVLIRHELQGSDIRPVGVARLWKNGYKGRCAGKPGRFPHKWRRSWQLLHRDRWFFGR